MTIYIGRTDGIIDNSLRAPSFAETPNWGSAVDVVGIGSEF
jgi:hypothetical protein